MQPNNLETTDDTTDASAWTGHFIGMPRGIFTIIGTTKQTNKGVDFQLAINSYLSIISGH
jgi:hypothetical protein